MLSVLATTPLTALQTPTTFAAGAIEEVIVVARKREESLQETPVAVTALTADGLKEARIQNIGDLTQQVPGLTRQEGQKFAGFAIRGVGSRTSIVTTEPGVGVYVDDIFIPRNDVQLVDIIDPETVQVLRGPQGTLFGKNTVGGALLITTRKPDLETVAGSVSAEIGSQGRQKYEAGISGPLVNDVLAGSIFVSTESQDGYREDADTGRDYGNIDRQGVLGQLRAQTGEFFTADIMGFYGEVDENAAPVNCLQANPESVAQGLTAPNAPDTFAANCDRSQALIDDEKVIMDRKPLRYTVDTAMGGLTLAWDTENLTIKSITGYLLQDNIETSADVDGASVYTVRNESIPKNQLDANGIDAFDQTRTFVSQEFQITGDLFDDNLAYTVGVFASKEDIDGEAGGIALGEGGWVGQPLPDGSIFTLTPTIGLREAYNRSLSNESAAIFGQVIYDINDTWQATLGARYTWEEKEISQSNYVSTADNLGLITLDAFNELDSFIQPLAPNPENPFQDAQQDWTVFSPAATISANLAPGTLTDKLDSGLLYLSLSEGFKAGGFSPYGEVFEAFEPEIVLTTEIGYKLDFLDGSVRVNGALYHSSYDDIQIDVTRTPPTDNPDEPSIPINLITNAGKATIYGGELELSVAPTENLFLGLNASYTKAEYDEFIDEDGAGNPVDRSAEDFAFIPETTLSAVASYNLITDLGVFVPRLSALYMDSIFIGLDPLSSQAPQAYVDDYVLMNLRVAWFNPASDGLEVAAFVNNLADEEYFGSGTASVDGIGSVAIIPGRQRTYGIEVNYNF
ncbi:hypothetical protein A3709_18905 [Halioglobus sp. HI00S01]|uniref:TonB-dependent receptor n=1 Tax=Halioglobus sp. HI00S01 TaxID=1822214 RepID=UPI0007C3E104|nr:TonB-dependent receptor [Halioglobus sp. HI00S01]KZX57694.1 hypothetical protein A3709_18905 [Halioglobus sp. HI00S01]